jgi:hypothetical protein
VTPLGGDVVVGQTADHVSHLGLLLRPSIVPGR